jgi:hypothetical protein
MGDILLLLSSVIKPFVPLPDVVPYGLEMVCSS